MKTLSIADMGIIPYELLVPLGQLKSLNLSGNHLVNVSMQILHPVNNLDVSVILAGSGQPTTKSCRSPLTYCHTYKYCLAINFVWIFAAHFGVFSLFHFSYLVAHIRAQRLCALFTIIFARGPLASLAPSPYALARRPTTRAHSYWIYRATNWTASRIAKRCYCKKSVKFGWRIIRLYVIDAIWARWFR